MATKRLLCVIMDGVGESSSAFGNAVYAAHTPTLDTLRQHHPFTTIRAHGTAVGLPSDADLGNSEVGHNAIGAGQHIDQGAKLVENNLISGDIFQGATWKEIIKNLSDSKGTLHFLGLLSDGGVHSHEKHLYSLMNQGFNHGALKQRIHILLDGRDVSPQSAEKYIENLEAQIKALNQRGADIAIASGGGRMSITMDRYEADWPMVKKGWETHVMGYGPQFQNALEALEFYRTQSPQITDQNIPPFVIGSKNKSLGPIEDGDGVILFNFRGDRAIEISRAFTDQNFKEFDRERYPQISFAGMMQYDGDQNIPPKYLVSPPQISHTLTEKLVDLKINQFACSETQKYGHVTFFWNGNFSGKRNPELEHFVEIPSDNIAFDKRPEMKAKEICDATIKEMTDHSFEFGRINFANGDMVGHTGNFSATVKAIEAVDQQLARLIEAADKHNYILLITADHGNAEKMLAGEESANWRKNLETFTRVTAHSTNPVPVFIYDASSSNYKFKTGDKFGLGNLANTFLQLMNIDLDSKYLPSLLEK